MNPWPQVYKIVLFLATRLVCRRFWVSRNAVIQNTFYRKRDFSIVERVNCMHQSMLYLPLKSVRTMWASILSASQERTNGGHQHYLPLKSVRAVALALRFYFPLSRHSRPQQLQVGQGTRSHPSQAFLSRETPRGWCRPETAICRALCSKTLWPLAWAPNAEPHARTE